MVRRGEGRRRNASVKPPGNDSLSTSHRHLFGSDLLSLSTVQLVGAERVLTVTATLPQSHQWWQFINVSRTEKGLKNFKCSRVLAVFIACCDDKTN